MKKLLNILFIAAFLGFILLAGAAYVLLPRQTYSFYENRNLAQLPSPSAESILDGSYFAGVDRALSDTAAGRSTLLKAKTALQLFLNVKILNCPVVNEVVVLDDLLLPFNPYLEADPQAVKAGAECQADNIAAARDTTEAAGGEYFFVMVPCQYVSYEEEYPDYLDNRAELTKTASAYLKEALADRNVNVIDAGETLLEPEVRDEAASRVDNHYTMKGAYLTYRLIMDAINAAAEEPVDVMEDYIYSELPNGYLGSRSRKLFGLSGVREALGMIDPVDEIPFRRYNWSEDNEVPATVWSLPSDPREEWTYGLYMGGDIGYTRIDTERPEKPTILIYGDSFTNAVECLMWYGFDEMHSLDFRMYDKMTLSGFIEELKPDYVVFIRDYEQLAAAGGNGGAR